MTTRRQRRERLLERANLAELEIMIQNETDPKIKEQLIERKEKISKVVDYRERMNYGI